MGSRAGFRGRRRAGPGLPQPGAWLALAALRPPGPTGLRVRGGGESRGIQAHGRPVCVLPGPSARPWSEAAVHWVLGAVLSESEILPEAGGSCSSPPRGWGRAWGRDTPSRLPEGWAWGGRTPQPPQREGRAFLLFRRKKQIFTFKLHFITYKDWPTTRPGPALPACPPLPQAPGRGTPTSRGVEAACGQLCPAALVFEI